LAIGNVTIGLLSGSAKKIVENKLPCFGCNPRLRKHLDKKPYLCRQKNGEYLFSLTIL